MHITPKLIMNCANLITTNTKVANLLTNNFHRLNDNVMHVFNHILSNGVRPMFAWSVLHLQNIKKLFHAFKNCQWLTKFQKLEYNNKLIELEFFLNNFIKNIHHFCNKILIPTSPHFFILGMLIIGRMKYWPTRNPRCATLHFHLPTCFYKLLNLGTNSFSLPSIHYKLYNEPKFNFPPHSTTSIQGNLQLAPPRKLDLTPIPSCVSFVKAWDLEIENYDQKTQDQQIQ